MKRTKKLYILLGVLVVICIATFALSKTEKKKENISCGAEGGGVLR